MLTLLEDSGPGVHDTSVAACSLELYRRLGKLDADGFHDNCTNNLYQGLAALGFRLTDGPRDEHCIPCPINLWMASPPVTGMPLSGSLWGVPDPRQKPGDHVLFRAEANVVVAFSACPASDVSGVNGPSGVSHDIHIQILDSAAA